MSHPSRNICWILSVLLLSACGSVDKYNPFSESKPAEPWKPSNATEYLCEGNKRFFVRMLDKENAAWLIYPEREVRLEKSSAGNIYTNSVAVLEINGSEATLKDGATIDYQACKAVAVTK